SVSPGGRVAPDAAGVFLCLLGGSKQMEIELNWRVRPGRECRYCGEMRLSEMVKKSGRPDGHRLECRRCKRADTKLRRRDPRVRQAVNNANARWRSSNPDYMARYYGANRSRWVDYVAA